MSVLQSIVEMSASQSLLNRVAASAAQQGVPNPRAWVLDNSWRIVSYVGEWAQLWEYYTVAPQFTENVNPDTGARSDVITDEHITAVIDALKPEAKE